MHKTIDYIRSLIKALYRLLLRFRYPVAFPEDITEALGIAESNSLTFDAFVRRLTSPSCCPTKLTKFMPRKDAENIFKTAQRKEFFRHSTLISYYFSEGWMEFSLHFDEQSALRRLYVQHNWIEKENGVEIPLKFLC